MAHDVEGHVARVFQGSQDYVTGVSYHQSGAILRLHLRQRGDQHLRIRRGAVLADLGVENGDELEPVGSESE